MRHSNPKKVLSTILSLCLVVAFAPAAYATEGSTGNSTPNAPSGAQANAATTAALDFTAENPETQGEGWTWDAATKTLTLDGCTLEPEGSYDAAIILPDGATVVAKGSDSTIKVAGTSGSNPRLAIYSEGAVTFSSKDNAMLNIEAKQGANGIDAAGISFTNAFVTILAGADEETGEGAAVHTSGTVSVDKSQVTVVAGGTRMGLYIEADEDCVANHAALTATYDKDTFLDVEAANASAVLIQGARVYSIFESADPISFEDHIGPMIGGRQASATNEDLFTAWSFTDAQSGWEYVEGAPDRTATHVRIAELHALQVSADATQLTVHKDDTGQAMQFYAQVFPSGAVDGGVNFTIDDESLISVEQSVDAQNRPTFSVRPKGQVGTATITIASTDTTLAEEDRPSTEVQVEITDTYVTVGSQAITGDYASEDGLVTFDAATNTLTLDRLGATSESIGTSKAEVFYEEREVSSVTVNAPVTYCRKAPLTVKIKGDVTLASQGQYSAGIAVAPYSVGLSPTDSSITTKTGIVNVEGEEGASLSFANCKFADIVLSSNMWPNDIDGTDNLSIAKLNVTATDESTYGIYSGRETGFYDSTLEIANKDVAGVRTGNMLTMSNCDIAIHDMDDYGIYAAGNGFYCKNDSKISVKNVGGYGMSAPSYAIIESGDVEVDGCGNYAIGGQYLWIYGGSVKVTNAEYGLLGMSAGEVHGGTVDVSAKHACMDIGFLQLFGGNVKLVSESGFAVRTTGQMGVAPGFVIRGGSLDAKTTGHAAILGGCGCTLDDAVIIDTPEGGKVLETVYEGQRVATITAADVEKIDLNWDAQGALDIEGGAEHVVIGVHPERTVDDAIAALPDPPAADASAEDAAAYKAAVNNVLEAYDALSDADKAAVTKLPELLAAQRAVAARDAADAKAAAERAAAELEAAQKNADESAAKAEQLEKDLAAAKKASLAKPTLTKKTKSSKKGKVTVAWKKVTGAKGYEVKVGSKTYTVKKATTLKKTVKVAKAKWGKKVKVQVRAYKKQGTNTLFSPWSKAKKVKIKK